MIMMDAKVECCEKCDMFKHNEITNRSYCTNPETYGLWISDPKSISKFCKLKVTKMTTEQDKAKAVAANMIKHGGGFAKMLGTKLAQMDLEEIKEFKESWPHYYRRYSEMAEVD